MRLLQVDTYPTLCTFLQLTKQASSVKKGLIKSCFKALLAHLPKISISIPTCLQKEKGGTVSVSTPFFSNATQCNVCGQSRLELTCITSLSLSYL